MSATLPHIYEHVQLEQRQKSKNNLSRNYLQINLKKTLPYNHLQTFVDQKPKQQNSCKFSENFISAIVIKVSYCVRG